MYFISELREPTKAICTVMSNRRVRFADDPLETTDRVPRAVLQTAQTYQPSSQCEHPEVIETPPWERAVLETSKRAEHLVNIRLAEQRAHDAMMKARSMQAEIRSNNARVHRFGEEVKNNGRTKSQTKPTETQLIECTGKQGDLFFNISKDQNIMTLPMAWITDVFLYIK